MTEDQREELAAVDVPAEGLVDESDEIDGGVDADATVVRQVRADVAAHVAPAVAADSVSPGAASDADTEAQLDPDATVVRTPRGSTDPRTDVDVDDDATVVRSTTGGADADFDQDATVVRTIVADVDAAVPGAQPRPAPAVAGPDHRGDPVPDPGQAADAAAQGPASRDAAAATSRSGVLRGAANSMPRVYGPRPVATTVSPEPVTSAAAGVAASNPRAQLPSLARRDRRARLITLVGYVTSVCVAGVGLWFVARLAFVG